MGKSKVKRQFKLGWRNKDLLILIIGTGVALHHLSLNITKYAASNSSESPERHQGAQPENSSSSASSASAARQLVEILIQQDVLRPDSERQPLIGIGKWVADFAQHLDQVVGNA